MNIITDNSKVNYNLVQENQAQAERNKALEEENAHLHKIVKFLEKRNKKKGATISLAARGLESMKMCKRENSAWYRVAAGQLLSNMREL